MDRIRRPIAELHRDSFKAANNQLAAAESRRDTAGALSSFSEEPCGTLYQISLAARGATS
jgi:hypothetical protein